MKKKNFKLLTLNKKSISNLESSNVNGGGTSLFGCASSPCSDSCRSINPPNCFVTESDITCDCPG